MTEKQGGSDVQANTTRAEPATDAGWYVLNGHKWFCSAPMSDLFLVLAQAPGGLTCFAVPRVLDDGVRNPFHLQRLKDKLGNRANASAEVEFAETLGLRLGEEGRGVATIIEMVAATRLDCILGSAALMRRAVAEANWHAAHRSAFGGLLSDAPLMRAVLLTWRLKRRRPRRCRYGSPHRQTPGPTRRSGRSAGSVFRWPSTGSVSGLEASSARRWSAWAETAMSRRAACRVSTGRLR